MARGIESKDFGEPHQKERGNSHAGNSLTPQGCAGRERGTTLHYKSARARTCPSAERPCTTGVRGLELARLVRGIRLAPRECAGRPCTVTKKTGTGGNSETPRNARDPMKAGTATPQREAPQRGRKGRRGGMQQKGEARGSAQTVEGDARLVVPWRRTSGLARLITAAMSARVRLSLRT